MIRGIGAFALVMLGATMAAEPARAQDSIGGAILGTATGAFIGGMATGRADGVITGAIVGGTAGAILGSESEKRRGYHWWHDNCYRRVAGGYARVSRRYCY